MKLDSTKLSIAEGVSFEIWPPSLVLQSICASGEHQNPKVCKLGSVWNPWMLSTHHQQKNPNMSSHSGLIYSKYRKIVQKSNICLDVVFLELFRLLQKNSDYLMLEFIKLKQNSSKHYTVNFSLLYDTLYQKNIWSFMYDQSKGKNQCFDQTICFSRLIAMN